MMQGPRFALLLVDLHFLSSVFQKDHSSSIEPSWHPCQISVGYLESHSPSLHLPPSPSSPQRLNPGLAHAKREPHINPVLILHLNSIYVSFCPPTL